MTTFTVDALANRLVDRGRARWKTLVVFALVGAAAGLAGSFLIKPVYQSETTFQAESQSNLQLSGSLAGLASQLGNLPFGGGGSTVNAQFFADILPTDRVLRRVTSDTFPWKGGQATLDQIYGYDDKPTPMREFVTANKLRRSLESSVNSRTNTVRFTVEAPSAELARALALKLLGAINDVNIELRQARASAERTFTTARTEDARNELTAAEAMLTRFYQRNRDITGAPALATEERRLQRNVDVAQEIYTQLRLQQEQAAVQAVRNTPAISVVDPPLAPVRKSRPKRWVAALIGAFAGLCLVGLRLVLAQDRSAGLAQP